MTDCWCGHSKKDHVELPISLEDNVAEERMGIHLPRIISCCICGNDHVYDSDFGGFLQYGVTNEKMCGHSTRKIY